MTSLVVQLTLAGFVTWMSDFVSLLNYFVTSWPDLAVMFADFVTS